MRFSLEDARECFAEDIRVVAAIESGALVRALARVPRERFLDPGPWLIRSELDTTPRRTSGADPRDVLHNVSVALDPARDLFNGAPATVAAWIDALAIAAGDRVVHIGCGTGYYTAILAELTGSAGYVTAIEIDETLAARAALNLAGYPWVTVARGDGRNGLPAAADVVLVHAGASHILDEWLDALGAGGRLLVPLTCALPGMGPSLGKGVVLQVRREDPEWTAHVASMVAIYSLQGVRDERRAAALGSVLMSGRLRTATRVRRDAHEIIATCLLHGATTCVSSA